MPNLVGIGNSQVPTNSMLGGLAYQDPAHANLTEVEIENIAAIKSKVNDTVNRVYVYNTALDSDGGAWRHKSQHTSWYNEGASATRGAKKEFPAVALLTLTETSLKIYDANDPNGELWGHYTQLSWDNNYNDVCALNGIILISNFDFSNTYSGWGTLRLNFPKDEMVNDCSTIDYSSYQGGTTRHLLTTTDYRYTGDEKRIISWSSYYITCVDMVVASDCVTDPDTKLPVPHIAAGTKTFNSVNNVLQIAYASGLPGDREWTVVSANGGYGSESYRAVRWLNGFWIFVGGEHVSGVTGLRQHLYERISPVGTLGGESISLNHRLINGFQFDTDNANWQSGVGSGAGNGVYQTRVAANKDGNFDIGYNTLAGYQGLNRVIFNANNSGGDAKGYHIDESACAYITADFNSGYMPNDIKTAIMADVATEDTTNYALTATQSSTGRLTSETYDNGDTAWQQVDNAGSNNGYVAIALNGLTIGQTYKVSVTFDNNATLDSGYNHMVTHKNNLTGEVSTFFPSWNKNNGSSETLIGYFTALSVNDDDLVIYTNGITLNVSNFSVTATNFKVGMPNLATRSVFHATARLTSHTYSSGATAWQQVDNTSTDNGYVSIYLRPLEVGKKYFVSIRASTGATLDSGYQNKIDFSGRATNINLDDFGWTNSATGGVHYSATFTATHATNDAIVLYANGQTINWSDFVVREVPDSQVVSANGATDRSQNRDDAFVVGQLDREPVAEGAELLGYGPDWGGSEGYIIEPRNTKYSFGTGDFMAMAWCYPTSNSGTYNFILELDPWRATNTNRFYFIRRGDNTRIYVPWNSNVAGSEIPLNEWTMVCAGRKNGTGVIYVNGELIPAGTVAFNGNLTQTGSTYWGVYPNSASTTYPFHGQLALGRIMAKCPDTQMIKKIYDDERKLFQPNAKCTLIGAPNVGTTSTNIKAVAYDNVKDILHVGTPTGRSDFRGLNRINSTTTAVTTQISASDGLIAEQ